MRSIHITCLSSLRLQETLRLREDSFRSGPPGGDLVWEDERRDEVGRFQALTPLLQPQGLCIAWVLPSASDSIGLEGSTTEQRWRPPAPERGSRPAAWKWARSHSNQHEEYISSSHSLQHHLKDLQLCLTFLLGILQINYLRDLRDESRGGRQPAFIDMSSFM